MGRPIRMFDSEAVYFVTNRCIQGRLLLTPSPRLNNIVGGVLAKAIELFAVDIFAFVFASNHFHLLVRAPRGNLSAFMQFLGGNIAKKVGKLTRWSDRCWSRRYSAEPVLDDDALVGRLRYILAHGVKEGLVDRPQDWPGVSSYSALAHGTTHLYRWPRSNSDDRIEETAPRPIALAPLPCWREVSVDHRRRIVRQIAEEIAASMYPERGGKRPLRKHLVHRHPHDRPRELKRSIRPLCHASTHLGVAAYHAQYLAFVDEYRAASVAFRRGRLDVTFPPGSFRPPGSLVLSAA